MQITLVQRHRLPKFMLKVPNTVGARLTEYSVFEYGVSQRIRVVFARLFFSLKKFEHPINRKTFSFPLFLLLSLESLIPLSPGTPSSEFRILIFFVFSSKLGGLNLRLNSLVVPYERKSARSSS